MVCGWGGSLAMRRSAITNGVVQMRCLYWVASLRHHTRVSTLPMAKAARNAGPPGQACSAYTRNAAVSGGRCLNRSKTPVDGQPNSWYSAPRFWLNHIF